MNDRMSAAQTGTAAQPPEWQPPSLEDMLDMEIDAWRPEAGDVVIGRVLRIMEAGEHSPFGRYPIVTIQRDSDGQCVNVHSFHSVLRRELSRQEVGEGDRVGIKYMGEVKGGDYGKFENYRVIKDHAIMESAPRQRVVVSDGQARPQQSQPQMSPPRPPEPVEDEIPF